MNVFLNVKTAEKCLQFGSKKCKTMLIGKNMENIINSELTVDKWKVSHKDTENGEVVLIEEFDGQVKIEKTEEQRYLGFVLSSKGNNMVNIEHMSRSRRRCTG